MTGGWAGSAEAKRAMGDDGTGHCRGCGNTLDRIDPGCPVCVAALAFLDGEPVLRVVSAPAQETT